MQQDQPTRHVPKPLTRTIWTLWFQGLDEAPWIVKACIDSWIRLNPDWQVVVLDVNNLSNYIQLDLSDEILANLSLAHQSDLIRLQLLARYGGLWVDATTLCMEPLDRWIDASCGSGFFAFQRPGRDRLIANWFMASEKDSLLVVRLYEKLRTYWITNQFQPLSQRQQTLTAALGAVLNKSTMTTRFWFHPIVTRLLRIYPYFVFHYWFERLVATDLQCHRIWKKTLPISATHARLIEKLGLHTLVTHAIASHVSECPAPLFKLTWKYDHSRCVPGTLLHDLITHAIAGRDKPGQMHR
jgi:hypothetical protein